MEVTMLIDGKEIFDIKQVIKYTGISNTKIHELMRHSKFPEPMKYKNKNIWYKSEIEAYIEKSRN